MVKNCQFWDDIFYGRPLVSNGIQVMICRYFNYGFTNQAAINLDFCLQYLPKEWTRFNSAPPPRCSNIHIVHPVIHTANNYNGKYLVELKEFRIEMRFHNGSDPIVEHWGEFWDSVGGDNPTKKLVFSKTVAAKSDHIFPMVVLLPGTYRLGCQKLSIFCFLYLCLAAHSPLSVRLVS